MENLIIKGAHFLNYKKYKKKMVAQREPGNVAICYIQRKIRKYHEFAPTHTHTKLGQIKYFFIEIKYLRNEN